VRAGVAIGELPDDPRHGHTLLMARLVRLALAFALTGVAPALAIGIIPPLPVATRSPPSGTTEYVATAAGGGVDAGNCQTQASPCLTLSYAESQASTNYVIQVSSGTYQGDFNTFKSGLTLYCITLRACILTPPVSSTRHAAVFFNGSGGPGDGTRAQNSTVDGFTIDGSGANHAQWNQGIILDGHNSVALNNTVEHIQNTCVLLENFFGGKNQTAHDNIIFDCGGPTAQSLQHCLYLQGPGDTAYNNLIVSCSGVGIESFHGAQSLNIFDNTVACARVGIEIGSGSISGHYATGGNDNSIVFNNNIANGCSFGSTDGVSPIGIENEIDASTGGSYGTGNNAYIGNLIFNMLNATFNKAGGALVGSYTAGPTSDPLFVNYQSDGSGNYMVNSGSPAKSAGTSPFRGVSQSHADLAGVIRSTVDIGAYAAP